VLNRQESAYLIFYGRNNCEIDIIFLPLNTGNTTLFVPFGTFSTVLSIQFFMQEKLKFSSTETSNFFPEVRRRVQQYFTETGLTQNANSEMVRKTIFIILSFLLTFGLIISGILPGWACFIVAGLHGFTAALVGLNITHDAIHGSFSSNNTVNRYLGRLLCVIGANDYLWRVKHNKIHHTYTNIPGHDDDLNQPKILRLSPDQPLWAIHRFQSFYAFFIYPMASISWIFIRDFVNLSRVTTALKEKQPPSTLEYIRFFGFKIFYLSVFLALPLLILPYAWYWIVAGFVFSHLVEGFTLAMVFQLAHLVEETHFPMPDKEGNLEHNWAVHQMYTTANFANGSAVATFLFGGLNFQIEHHLFPQICHIHYPAMAKIVKETAKEFNVPYYSFETLGQAIGAHYRFMQKNGKGEIILHTNDPVPFPA
jgi:linoleoyl-CoA desaturase